MPDLMPKDIEGEVLAVLRSAHKDHKGYCYLTAYQILDRLPPTTRGRLIDERGLTGSYTAVSLVTRAADKLPGIDHPVALDAQGVVFTIAGQPKTAGNPNVAIYRLKIAEGDG